MPDSRDPCENFHGGDDASCDAWDNQDQSRLEAMRWQIWRAIRDRGIEGATSDELEAVLGHSHQTTSARLTELRRDGHITRNGRRRRTRSGASAHVVVAVELHYQRELFSKREQGAET